MRHWTPLPIAAHHTSPPHIYGDNDDDEQSTSYGPPVFPGNSLLYSSNDESTSSSKSPLLPSPPKQRKLDDNSIQSISSSKSPSLPKPSKAGQRRIYHNHARANLNLRSNQKKENQGNQIYLELPGGLKQIKLSRRPEKQKKKKQLEKIKLAAIQAEKDKKDMELKDKFNCSNVSIDLEKCDDTIDKNEGRKAKPIELKEKDPILDHVSHEQPDQVDLLTEKDEPITSKGSEQN